MKKGFKMAFLSWLTVWSTFNLITPLKSYIQCSITLESSCLVLEQSKAKRNVIISNTQDVPCTYTCITFYNYLNLANHEACRRSRHEPYD